MAEPDLRLDAYMGAVTQVRERVLAFSSAFWDGLGSYRDADVERLIQVLVPRVQAGQIQVAQLTSAYLAGVAGESAALVDTSEVTNGRGVDPAEVYRRPAVTVYSELAAGTPFTDAVAAGAVRLASLVGMDMQMSKVRQARRSLERSGAKFYRRVLTGNENCAMCVIASTQRYSTGDLMPIHPGCDCGVKPLRNGEDAPQTIDVALLESTHEHVADIAGIADRSGRAPDYRKLIVTHDHGEQGPSLRWLSDKFTGPSEI